MTSVLQQWVMDLPFMQQSVLLSTVRGPDGMAKEHPTKALIRWYRRCILISAFDGGPLLDPLAPGGGSFTGPIPAGKSLNVVLSDYLKHQDEVPLHFHLHLVHSAEILGYKHTDDFCREWWHYAYQEMVNYMHLQPESLSRLDYRLGDNEKKWRAAEASTIDFKPVAGDEVDWEEAGLIKN